LIKSIIINYDKCTGCRLCELTCSLQNENEANPELSRIKVYSYFPGIDIPTICRHCEDCLCVDGCKVKALEKDKEGILTCNTLLCNGCGVCVRKCPAKAITMKPEEKKPLICNLCNETKPACVEICPTGALEYVVMPFDSKFLAVGPEKIAASLEIHMFAGGKE
jgi:Fe-S-cluster-containing hydrogenase component 2